MRILQTNSPPKNVFLPRFRVFLKFKLEKKILRFFFARFGGYTICMLVHCTFEWLYARLGRSRFAKMFGQSSRSSVIGPGEFYFGAAKVNVVPIAAVMALDCVQCEALKVGSI